MELLDCDLLEGKTLFYAPVWSSLPQHPRYSKLLAVAGILEMFEDCICFLGQL